MAVTANLPVAHGDDNVIPCAAKDFSFIGNQELVLIEQEKRNLMHASSVDVKFYLKSE